MRILSIDKQVLNISGSYFKALSCSFYSDECAWPTHDEQTDRAKFLKLSNLPVDVRPTYLESSRTSYLSLLKCSFLTPHFLHCLTCSSIWNILFYSGVFALHIVSIQSRLTIFFSWGWQELNQVFLSVKAPLYQPY